MFFYLVSLIVKTGAGAATHKYDPPHEIAQGHHLETDFSRFVTFHSFLRFVWCKSRFLKKKPPCEPSSAPYSFFEQVARRSLR